MNYSKVHDKIITGCCNHLLKFGQRAMEEGFSNHHVCLCLCVLPLDTRGYNFLLSKLYFKEQSVKGQIYNDFDVNMYHYEDMAVLATELLRLQKTID